MKVEQLVVPNHGSTWDPKWEENSQEGSEQGMTLDLN